MCAVSPATQRSQSATADAGHWTLAVSPWTSLSPSKSSSHLSIRKESHTQSFSPAVPKSLRHSLQACQLLGAEQKDRASMFHQMNQDEFLSSAGRIEPPSGIGYVP